VAADPGRDPDLPATLSTSVNRLTLREGLAAGLGERLRFGREFTGYSEDGGRLTLHFADGTRESAEVLIGADGVNSRVRAQYLPHAQILDTGARCVYGRTPLDARVLPLLPAALHEGFTAIVGGHVGLAAGLVRFRNRLGAGAGVEPGPGHPARRCDPRDEPGPRLRRQHRAAGRAAAGGGARRGRRRGPCRASCGWLGRDRADACQVPVATCTLSESAAAVMPT
jgi:2-polyprenyl-6-methoxyphenol hydroxylase-like FAD-dependent oxidoreductase